MKGAPQKPFPRKEFTRTTPLVSLPCFYLQIYPQRSQCIGIAPRIGGKQCRAVDGRELPDDIIELVAFDDPDGSPQRIRQDALGRSLRIDILQEAHGAP